MKKMKQLNFLITGTGRDSAEKSPFLVALAEQLPGTSVFQKKRSIGTLGMNYASAQRQLRAAVKQHSPERVVLVGHSEGGIHAMRLAASSYVDLAVVCATPVCTFREAMLYQHECRPPLRRKIRAMLNSEPWTEPASASDPRARKAVRDYLTAVGFPATDEAIDYQLSLMSYSGAQIMSDAQLHKLAFVFAKHDMNVHKDLSISNISSADASIPIKTVHAFDHMFHTKTKKKVSGTAVRQIVALTRPKKRSGGPS